MIRQGLVAEVPSFTLNEGNRVVIVYPNGSRQDIPLKSVESRASFPTDEFIAGGPELLAQAIQRLSGEMHNQMDKDLIATLQKARPEHGGMFRGKTEDEAFEDLLRGLQRMDMTFDEDGTPSIMFISHPDNIPLMKALDTPERKAIVDSIIEEKRLEWIRRESNRRLVD
jgi:hypothetical protein